MILKATEIAEATGGALVHPGDPGPIRTDTRRLRPGDWFLALRGDNFDGHAFLKHAAAAGCAGVVAEEVPEDWEVGWVRVDDTLRALQDCASLVRRWFRGPVVGITGSAGKTTTRALAALVLESLGRVHQTAGNLNNHVGLPLTLLDMPVEAEILVLELGMSGPGEIRRLQEIAIPDVRLITNVGVAHTEGTGGIEGVARCKQELFDGARPGDTLIVNADDPAVSAMPLPEGVRVLRYGMSPGCDVRLTLAHIDPRDLATITQIALPGETITVRLPVPGLHLAHDAAAAAAIGHALRVPPAEIAAGLARYEPVGMRMRVERLASGAVLINDAYNANPASTRAALETLSSLDGRRFAVLGDMLELGEHEADAHAELMRLAGTLELELLVLVGPRYGAQAALAEGAPAEVRCVASEELVPLGRQLRDRLQDGDILLLKGSRGLRVERVLQGLHGEES